MENSGQRGVIFHMLSQKILNAQKAILSIFRHFYFFPYDFKGKKSKSFRMSQKSFLDNKKSR